jgi:hypothetical protein
LLPKPVKTIPDQKDNGPVSEIQEKTTHKPEELPVNQDGAGEFFRTAVLAILLALFIRTFFFEPCNIPS